MKETARARVIVKGRVQGVSFRAYAVETATELGLTGWVKNSHDGGVEILAEGKKDAVEKLIEWCKDGPPVASVRSVHVEWEPFSGDIEYFDISY